MKTPVTIEQIRAREGARAFRSAEVSSVNEELRTVELAFSSEAEVPRWYGFEVLSHDPGAIDLARMRDGAPLLLEHEWDEQIGVVESVSIDADRRGRAVVRFSRSARAEEIFQDVKDKIRRHVSVGYIVNDAKLTEERDGADVWTITSWMPYEISIVSVPADITVGIGRNMENPHEDARSASPENQPATSTTTENMDPEENKTPAADNAAQIRAAADNERKRSAEILALGEKFSAADLARDAVKDGATVADFQRSLLDHVNGRIQRPLNQQMRDADIGLTDKEVQNFSFMKVIRALSEPTDSRAQREAAFEFEASRAAADKLGKAGDKFVVPPDVLTRAMNTGTAGGAAGNTGGFGIATTMMAQSFVDILRNRTTIMQLGTVMGGLVGNVDIPRQVAAAQGYWLGEDDDASESNLELGQFSLSPKTVAAYSEITRKLMQQSSLDVEALVRADLAKALALTIDKAGYYGSGNEYQPLGVLNHTGVNVVNFAATQPTYAELVQMETEVALDNADVNSMAYVSNAAFRGAMKTALKFPGVGTNGTIWEPGNTVNGYRTEITNQVATGDVFMGNFADLLVAMWGGLELTVDPYSNSKKGRVRVVVFQDVDFALRRVESFCIGRKP